ncbi:MAG: hypothetical protein EWV55_22995 [Microcystis viridis Mv_BB_P_19951000_S69]|jgi:hypothetical protein|uniref:HEPN domain-containing protein n=2 Tax=Microcystis TaxID=1125 RepID=A0A552I528_MICVR|nr:hypothetical protein [Microcystis aeruginosa LG13-12]TRU68684.1 MAG: hypothetical protein EWV55_22995 [Microcystis viridis Mv_BB_P_19951000_S69]TRU78527.1 MAG: hypothetical protein EWV77_04110 [Microcystis viridis Mv_BB_P_19951000_S68D]TRU78835.1 MAG: hypothetical protein EWV47_01195 [Microcystis viridis Mv_BB_P_19951000_S68]TRU86045.1 MAG: hypothetical protein EWV46_11195 [Microcystis viridis Mv_BB_P_19951000_S69D]TRV05641.1 MAG: hypothetical protein EWV41_15550 [Microcystis wesenbergii Mw
MGGVIPFTDRELQKAWRENQEATKVEKKTNAHRLLLFYSVECGLKAVLLKRQSKDCTDSCPELVEVQHDINKLLDKLAAGEKLKLPPQLGMKPLKNNQERKFSCGEINQMWRYGGCCENIKDGELERKLLDILSWIAQELQRL